MLLTKFMETDMATKTARNQRKGTTTKKAQLIRMLSAKSGTDVEAISNKLGWQQHTTRAAITGLKKVGYTVRTKKEGGRATRYWIVEDAAGARNDGRPTASEAGAAPESANAG